MSAPVWLGVGGALFLAYGLLVAPWRRRGAVPPPRRPGRPSEEGASGRHVPPAGPLGLPLSAAVVDRLTGAGFTAAEVHAWWWRPRHELDGATPREALLHGGGHYVLGLAERDVAQIVSVWEVPA